ncbi:GNAT family N-acetyltransferase [Paenibacillus solisilvae]|uniref:GNAT family N-acetyltransferase n=1 Tax=Paenibacillus solisilvae TaxID=2486751 RepID=A0ABW0VS46_9BACL
MKVKLLSGAEWMNVKEKIITFAVRFGDSRLTPAGIAVLRELSPSLLINDKSESAVAVALEDGKLAGFAAAVEAGERACLIVVHPQRRGQGLATSLLLALQIRCSRLTCSVAADNPASMQACFRAHMKAVSMHSGPTGKPTLRFES